MIISLSTTTSSFTVFAASQLVFTQQPNNALVGTVLSPVKLSVEDGVGSTLPVTISVTISSTPPGVGGTLTVTTVSGVATFSNLSFAAAGLGITLTGTVTLVGPPLVSSPSNPFNIYSANNLFFTQQPSNTSVGAPILPAPAVAIRSGVTILNVSIPVTISVNSQSFTATSVGGIATFPAITISSAGTFTLSPSVSPPLGSMPPSNPFQVAAAPITPDNPDLKKYRLTATLITDTSGNTIEIVPTGSILPPVINTYVVSGVYESPLPTFAVTSTATAFHMDQNARLIISSGDIVGNTIVSQPVSVGLEPATFGTLSFVSADGDAQRMRGSRSGILYINITDATGSAGVNVGQHNGAPLPGPGVGVMVAGQYTSTLPVLSDNSPFVLHSDALGRVLVTPDLNGVGTDQVTAPTTPAGFFIVSKYTNTLPVLTPDDASIFHSDARGRILVSPDLNGIGTNASAAPATPVGFFTVAKFTNTLPTLTNNNASIFHTDVKGRLIVSPDLNGVGTDGVSVSSGASGFFIAGKFLSILPTYSSGTASFYHTDRRGRVQTNTTPGMIGAPPTLTNVPASIVNVTLLASNLDRLGAYLVNDSPTANLFLKFGATASITSYTVKIPPLAYYEFPWPCYTGQVDGIWDVAVFGDEARITELT